MTMVNSLASSNLRHLDFFLCFVVAASFFFCEFRRNQVHKESPKRLISVSASSIFKQNLVRYSNATLAEQVSAFVRRESKTSWSLFNFFLAEYANSSVIKPVITFLRSAAAAAI